MIDELVHSSTTLMIRWNWWRENEFNASLTNPTGLNFINILRAHFSYKILAPKIYKAKQIKRKAAQSGKTLIARSQFHQHFMCAFFIQKSFWQLFSSYM